MRRAILIGAGLLVTVVAAAVAFVGPRNIVGMLRYDSRREGDFKVGDKAPDVVVLSIEGAQVHLRERFGDRPAVIVFGSFT